MRLHRFYVSEPVGTNTEFSVHSIDLAHQVKNVFRLKKGDSVIVFDGSGSDYECSLVENDGKSVTLRVVSAARSRYMPARKVFLYAALVKKDNFEFIVEKATELGVTDIVPVLAERSEKKGLNEGRLRKILVEASEQSGRGDVPEVHPIADLQGALSRVAEGAQVIAFHTEGEAFTGEDLDGVEVPAAVFIGPEGGWSPDEIDLFHKNDVAVRCLGSQVLRAETAVVAALSMVVFR